MVVNLCGRWIEWNVSTNRSLKMLRKKLRLTPLNEDAKHDHLESGNISNNNTLNMQNPANTSKYFISDAASDIPTTILQIEGDLSEELKRLKFMDPVCYVYNPLEYASEPHRNFVYKYCLNEKKILILGMNPGPWGMCQTGIPFGEVNYVRDWLKIDGSINKPERECPSREVAGLDCHRSEESGKRFFGLLKRICGTPENFFRHAFIYNYCPLAFLNVTGANVTPSSLKGAVKKELEEICNKTLVQVIELLKIEIVIGLGRYAEAQVKNVLKRSIGRNIEVIYMPHPSPRAVGNENWPEKAEAILVERDLMKYIKA